MVRVRRAAFGRAWVTACLLLLSFVSASLAAAPAEFDRPAALAPYFHADDTHLVVLQDPLPHLKALLTSRTLAQAFKTGALAKNWTDEEGRAFEPSEVWDFFVRNERWIPSQLAVATSDAGVDDLSRVMRLLSLYELLYKGLIGDPDDAALTRDVGEVRASLAQELASLRLPSIRVLARFRTAEQANTFLELVRGWLTGEEPNDLPKGVTVTSKPKSISLRLDMSEHFGVDDAEVLRWLKGLGLVDAEALTADPNLTRALKSLKAEATLEYVDGAVLLTLGPTDAGGAAGLPPAVVQMPAAVGRVNADTVAWARWTGGKLGAAARQWLAFHEKWTASASYAEPITESLGYSGLLDVMRSTAATLARLAPTGSARLWSEDDHSRLRATIVEESVEPVSPLAASGLASVLPADVAVFDLQSSRSLGMVVSDLLMQGEDHLLLRRARPAVVVASPPAEGEPVREPENDAPDRPDGANEPRDRAAAPAPDDNARPPAASQPSQPPTVQYVYDRADRFQYFKHFSRLRDVLNRQAATWFEGGSAVLVGTQGRVDRLELMVEMDGRPQRISGRSMPTPELAMAGLMRGNTDATTARQRLEQALGAFADGLRSASRGDIFGDRPFPPAAGRTVPVDLGLGVPTWGFESDWLRQATGEAKLQFAAEGDVRPHAFLLQKVLVLSTSPRLSKRMVTAHQDSSARHPMPDPAEGPLVGFASYSGDATATAMEEVAGWIAAYTESQADREDEHHASHFVWVGMEEHLRQLAQLVRLVDEVEAVSSQPINGTIRTTHWRLEIAKP